MMFNNFLINNPFIYLKKSYIIQNMNVIDYFCMF